MSETDDRMERAERIRKMRESREPGDEDDGLTASDDGAATNEGADDATAADEADDAATDDVAPVDAAADDVAPVDAAGEEADDADDVGDAAATGTDADEDGRQNGSTADVAVTGAPSEDVGVTEASSQAVGEGASGSDDATGSGAADAGVSVSTDDGPSGGIAPLGGSSGFSLPGQEEMEAAAGGDGTDETAGRGRAEGERGGAARARGSVAAATEPSVRVLEFSVGDQSYCIDIERVEEIVKREAVTRVPNTDDYVEGVVDLRGQITTILDTRQLLDVEESGSESLLVIFAPDAFEEHGTVGWIVDSVRQVVPVTDSQVRTPPSDEDHIRGIVDRDDEDELVVWIRPGEAMTRAVDLDDVE